MDLNEIVEQVTRYIDPAMLIVAATLVVIGYIVKRTPRIPNWAIYYILLTLGIAAGLAILGLNIHGAIQGVLAAALAVFAHEGYKQTRRAVDGPQARL